MLRQILMMIQSNLLYLYHKMYSNISLTIAFFLGALHAFQPGHGKAILAAYLVGSRGRVLDAIWLGLVLTATHTFSVIILGIVIKVAYGAVMAAVVQQSPDAQPIPIPGAKIIQLVAGALILGVGIWIIMNRKRILTHDHHDHHDHSHHDHDDHNHDHDHKQARGIWQLSLLGISGGMVPCAEGIGLLLAAVAAGQAGRGLMLVLSFSLGIALVIVTIGIIICKLASIAESVLQKTGRWVNRLPIISGSIIAALGCYSIVKVLISL